MSKKRKNGNGLNGNGYNESWINGNGNCRNNGYGSICSNGNNGTLIIEKRSPTKTAINITAKTPNQKLLFQSIRDNTITIVCGPAGSGKTKISVVCGLYEFIKGNYKKMIFTRPCVEANGENLGFLPGDLNEKINPYMYPIFDFLSDYLSPQKINYYMQNKEFVTLPLAFQRGMTFHDSFVLLDEGQNTTLQQVRMFLTRIGENCKVVITGDPDQSDIKGKNGLVDACERLEGVTGLGIVRFTEEDIVRSSIVAEIERRYNEKK